jgi:hypothetical protein
LRRLKENHPTDGKGLLCLPLVGKGEISMNEKKKIALSLDSQGLLMEAATVTERLATRKTEFCAGK